MIALLSPAKKLALPKDLTGLPPALLNSKPSPFSQPQLQHESTVLVDILKKKSAKEISTLMSISEKLSTQNHARWQMWQPTPKTVQLIGNQKFFPAGYLFQGDVYQGLDLKSLTVAEVKKLNELVYILSGLYGALRLLDLIMPYRLEMGTELKNPRGKNLLYYWEDQVAKLITKNFEQTSSNKIILNLASEEYFNVIKMYLPSDITVIQPLFYDEIKGNYKMVSFYAKKARGLMVRYLAKTWSVGKTKSLSNTLSYLKAFNLEKYYFSEASKKSAPLPATKTKAHYHYLLFYRDH